jgi:hypothetical protein
MLSHMGSAECAAALGELLDDGYRLERAGDALTARPRRDGEGRQFLAEALDGLSLAVAPPEPEVVVGSGKVEAVEVVKKPRESSRGLLQLSEPAGDLSLSLAEWVSSTRAILAKRGSGKTYFAGVMVEEVLAANEDVALTIIDPGSAWWGLLATSGGEPSPHKILLLGGSRGHLPLGSRDGAAVAEIVRTIRPVTVLLDLSKLAPVEQHRLVADFCERLWALESFPIHLVVDEADEFVPQRFGALPQQQRRSLDALARIFMRGRLRGMGGTLISLRPAVVSKNLLSQVDELCLLRLSEVNDLRAVCTWLENFDHQVTQEQRAECLSHLPVLPTGTAYFLRGGDSPAFRRFRVRSKHTYDSSKTLRSGVVDNPRLSSPSAEVLATASEILKTEVSGES